MISYADLTSTSELLFALFQIECLCKTFHMKMTIFMRMNERLTLTFSLAKRLILQQRQTSTGMGCQHTYISSCWKEKGLLVIPSTIISFVTIYHHINTRYRTAKKAQNVFFSLNSLFQLFRKSNHLIALVFLRSTAKVKLTN